jgi:hypothetical protein
VIKRPVESGCARAAAGARVLARAGFDHFWEALKRRRGKQAGTRTMIDLLLLGREHCP